MEQQKSKNSMKDTTMKDFLGMCHILYDNIHGQQQVKKIFDPIKENHIRDLIKIYRNSNLFYRWFNINNYIKNSSIYKDNEYNTIVTNFYVNAIQHFLYKDY